MFVMKEVRVLVAEENQFIRAGIRACLSEKVNIESLEEVTDTLHLRDRLNFHELPNVLILNAEFDKVGNLISEIAKAASSIQIIVIGQGSEESYASRILRAGAAAYLRLDCGFDELVSAIITVSNERVYLGDKPSLPMLNQLNNKKLDKTVHHQLSTREHQIFMMICTGVPLTKIGLSFGISVKTVSTYRSRILKKMNLSNNAELVQYAVKHQILNSRVA